MYLWKTGLNRQKLRFEIKRILKEGKQHHNTDLAFWIVPTTKYFGKASSDLSESVCN